MGRYKTDSIYWVNKYYSPEDLISWGFSCAPKHPEVTIDVAAHILREAFIIQDNNLFNAGNELMGAVGSPRDFVASESLKQATANNNRPSESPALKLSPALSEMNDIKDNDWDDRWDSIFNDKVKPKAIKKAMEEIVLPKRISKLRFYYVSFRMLKFLKYLTDKATGPDYLRWINLHFNCGWIDDNEHRKQFVFALENSSKNLDDQEPYDWDEKTIKGGSGKYHRELAITLKNTFTQTLVNGNAIDDSELFVNLRDRGKFLQGGYHLQGDEYIVHNEDDYINNGK
ncbi:MAG: hypothetical protein J5965_17195 [Aeriscardovia sp.]|nr:hypothetical protein [Aeriscardovia sp.]